MHPGELLCFRTTKEKIMKKTTIATSVLVLLSLLLSSCNLQAASPTQMGPDQINTIAAATVQALTTQMAPPPATATSLATEVPTATATLAVPTLNLTAIPTLSLATSTLIPLPTTAGSTECNKVTFLTDETVPDNTVFKPGVKFVKTWKIQNAGTCTWTTLYSAFMFSNDPASPAISGEADTSMKASITPGGNVVISVNLTAPKEEGTYRQYWKMQDADGKPFGIGGPNGPGWYVQIKVSKTGVVTPASVTASATYSGPDYTGMITATGAFINFNWQAYNPGTSSWVDLTSQVGKTFSGTNVPVDPYTGGIGGACTAAGLTTGNLVKVRLNLNEYGYKYPADQTCP
jgi:hypothetical protein